MSVSPVLVAAWDFSHGSVQTLSLFKTEGKWLCFSCLASSQLILFLFYFSSLREKKAMFRMCAPKLFGRGIFKDNLCGLHSDSHTIIY